MGKARVTFRPPLWATALLVVTCALFILAGRWQLGRAQEKRALFAAWDAGASTTALAGPLTDTDAQQSRYRILRLTGHYDAAHQILLDNIVHDGKPGYEVLTPLITDGGAVLVNRGWLPAAADRNVLPDITVSGEPRAVTGQIDRLARPGIVLTAPPATDSAPWPRRLLFPTAAEIAAQLGYPVHDYQLKLLVSEADGFIRDWRPDVMTPETHLGYAIQWFSFAAAVVAIYVAVNLKRTKSEIQ